MTALVIIITGGLFDPANSDLIASNQGGALTSVAMGGVIPWFPYILAIAVFLFAFSTMISWSYYGERCWCIFILRQIVIDIKSLFLIFTFLGSIMRPQTFWTFLDLMILAVWLH